MRVRDRMLPTIDAVRPVQSRRDIRGALSRFLAYGSWLALLALAMAAATFYAWETNLPRPLWVAVALTPVAVALASGRLAAAFLRLPGWTRTWQAEWAVVVLGLALRIAWSVLLPPATLSSDSLSYYTVALRLLNEGRFAIPYPEDDPTLVLLAWRPPGYPFLLAGWFGLFGASSASIVALNLVLYLGAAAALAALARRVAGPGATFAALALLAVWPYGIVSTGVTLTEGASLLTYLLAVLWFLHALRGGPAWAVVSGLIAGLGVLVRPAMLLMPDLWAACALMAPVRARRAVLVVGLATATMALVILPWTVRNYERLHHFVLVSTNGGSVLYRANNPLATGNWTGQGARDLDALAGDEVLWNATGNAWAREWILAHPVQFAGLAIKKQAHFWSRDEAGNGPRRWWPGFTATHPAAMDAIEKASNAWWFALLGLVVVALVARRRQFWTADAELTLVVLAILLLAGTHAVFESHSRYHYPAVGFLTLIAGLSFGMPRDAREDGARPG